MTFDVVVEIVAEPDDALTHLDAPALGSAARLDSPSNCRRDGGIGWGNGRKHVTPAHDSHQPLAVENRHRANPHADHPGRQVRHVGQGSRRDHFGGHHGMDGCWRHRVRVNQVGLCDHADEQPIGDHRQRREAAIRELLSGHLYGCIRTDRNHRTGHYISHQHRDLRCLRHRSSSSVASLRDRCPTTVIGPSANRQQAPDLARHVRAAGSRVLRREALGARTLPDNDSAEGSAKPRSDEGADAEGERRGGAAEQELPSAGPPPWACRHPGDENTRGEQRDGGYHQRRKQRRCAQ